MNNEPKQGQLCKYVENEKELCIFDKERNIKKIWKPLTRSEISELWKLAPDDGSELPEQISEDKVDRLYALLDAEFGIPYDIYKSILKEAGQPEQMQNEELELLRRFYHLIQQANSIDFTNGVEAFGIDEGRSVGNSMYDDLTKRIENLKSGLIKYQKQEPIQLPEITDWPDWAVCHAFSVDSSGWFFSEIMHIEKDYNVDVWSDEINSCRYNSRKSGLTLPHGLDWRKSLTLRPGLEKTYQEKEPQPGQVTKTIDNLDDPVMTWVFDKRK